MKNKPRPVSIIYIMTYFLLLGIGALFGGLLILITVIPAILQLGPFFQTGALIVGLLAISSIIMSIIFFIAIIGQWRATSGGRTLTLIMAVVMSLICIMSMPALLISNLGSVLYLPLLTAVLILAASIGVIWSLRSPSLVDYFSQ